MRGKFIVLTGCGDCAVIACNEYIKRLGRKNLMIIEEIITAKRVCKYLKGRLKKKGLMWCISSILLKCINFLFNEKKEIIKSYKSDYVVEDINGAEVIDLLENTIYTGILTNACSLLNKKVLSVCKTEVVNIHNGINPRYRGAGNVYAIKESAFENIGVTVHCVDESIDNGKIIAIERIAVRPDSTIESINRESFYKGSIMVCHYLQEGKVEWSNNVQATRKSKFYSYPVLKDYYSAKRALYKYKIRKYPLSERWISSFIERAGKYNKSVLEKQHWSDVKTVKWHDEQILSFLNKNRFETVVDVGCGDGRYADMIENNLEYIGLDFSEPTMSLHKIRSNSNGKKIKFLKAQADDLPIENDVADVILAIGLFQHVDDLGNCVKEYSRCIKNNGVVVINTLRMFPFLELLALLLPSIFNSDIRRLIHSLFLREYGELVNGDLLATRFSYMDICCVLRSYGFVVEKVQYNGLLGGETLAREMIIYARYSI